MHLCVPSVLCVPSGLINALSGASADYAMGGRWSCAICPPPASAVGAADDVRRVPLRCTLRVPLTSRVPCTTEVHSPAQADPCPSSAAAPAPVMPRTRAYSIHGQASLRGQPGQASQRVQRPAAGQLLAIKEGNLRDGMGRLRCREACAARSEGTINQGLKGV